MESKVLKSVTHQVNSEADFLCKTELHGTEAQSEVSVRARNLTPLKLSFRLIS